MFSDGSVHVQSGIGYGAFLFTSDLEGSVDTLKRNIQIKRFEPTSSTKLELQIFLLALSQIDKKTDEVIVYSDSQNLSQLMDRRLRLEQNNYRSKTNRPLNNAELYRAIFSITDNFQMQFVKVKGHKRSQEKDKVDQVFTLVDRACRSALRKEMNGYEKR